MSADARMKSMESGSVSDFENVEIIEVHELLYIYRHNDDERNEGLFTNMKSRGAIFRGSLVKHTDLRFYKNLEFCIDKSSNK